MSAEISNEGLEIFCVKCRKKVHPTGPVTTGIVEFERKKTGKKGTRYTLNAKCPNCGTDMKRFIKKSDS